MSVGGGIGKDGDPMYTLTAMMGGHFEPAVCLWERDDGETVVHSGSSAECVGGQPVMHTLSSEGMQGKGCICYVEEDDGHGDLDADGCRDTETKSGHSSDTRQP